MVRVHFHIKRLLGRRTFSLPAAPHCTSIGLSTRRPTRSSNATAGYH